MESPSIVHLAEDESAPSSRARALDYSTGSEVMLLEGLQNSVPGADVAFFARYERDVRSVLTRIMGASPDVADAVQDTFIRALRSAFRVRDALALRAWVRRVATSVAFDHLRERQRQRWQCCTKHALVDVPAACVTPEAYAALRGTCRVLSKLPLKERAAFHLRYVDEMDLPEIAAACSISLATVKRRLARAELRFRSLAQRQPELAEWVNRDDA